MVQPNPPGAMPLYEGLTSEWNDIVEAIPEDRRAELAPKLKERLDRFEPLKQWDEFQKSGITPEHARTAMDVFSMIENNPKQVYETLGNHLGITPQQAQEVVEQIEEGGSDSEIAALKQQIDTLSQITLAKSQKENQDRLAAQADAELQEEFTALKKKYGDDIPEDEIAMRMLHKNMTAEQAYLEYDGMVAKIRSLRPSPLVMGGGGNVPAKQIDVKKLNAPETKNLVAQMLDHANALTK